MGLFDGIFWGVFLIALGAWFIVRRFVPVHIPVVRIIIGALLIWAGVRFLVHGPVIHDGSTVVFGRSTMEYSSDGEKGYNVIFSNGTIDLSGVRLEGSDVRTEVNVIFGSGTLRIDPSTPVRVDMTAAFGSIEAPDERTVSFGDSVYTTPSYTKGSPALEVHAVAVFGRLQISP
ncbi:MAG TPA: LiaF domain-containing protein [Spirochaetia bacterium]